MRKFMSKTANNKTVAKNKTKKNQSTPLVIIGSDHAAFHTKELIVKTLAKAGYTIVDVGGFSETIKDDYPVYAKQVAHAVANEKNTFGILICGTGTGMAIAANKVPGIRAAVAYDAYSAKMARQDNDANIIALRARKTSSKREAKLALLFLKEPFSGMPRHKRRINLISKMEAENRNKIKHEQQK